MQLPQFVMRFLAFASLLLLVDISVFAQAPPIVEGESFRFVRIKYEANTSGGGRWGRWRSNAWATDWPTAEINLHKAIERTTRIPLGGEPIVLELDDKNIFQYPVLYIPSAYPKLHAWLCFGE